MIHVIALMILISTFILRCFPRLFFRIADIGADHWFWKAYIESYHKNHRFPPIMPQYLLDEHQWYPPIFPLLLAHMPSKIFDKYSYFVAPSIDLLRLGLVMVVAGTFSRNNVYWVVAVSGAIYALTPVLISYNIQLNPRGLGSLLLDGLIVLIVWGYFMDGPNWIWIAVLLLAGLVLLTHKMTAQLFWFLCIVSGLATMDWRFLALIPASILVALILSKGFYWKVLKAHWDIVTFWNRNWRWLQAHPIKESPIYGEPGYETPTKLHRKGWTGVKRHLTYLIAYNPWPWILFCYAGLNLIGGERNFLTDYVWVWPWAVIIALFSLITVFVPSLKCLGSGYLYLYNLAFPVALIWGKIMSHAGLKSETIFLAAGFVLSIGAIIFFYKHIRTSSILRVDHDFERVLNFLKRAPRGPILCLPPQWYDLVAYKTDQPVLYGGHGYGFRTLEPIFPRLLISLKEICSRYHARYLLTMDSYIKGTKLIDELPKQPLFYSGSYQVFEIR
ncbi:MAG: hypothetical protein ACFFCW_08645 [Candidatus Hodarchaeota archaeon]